jgi:serine/threonine-protein kinase
MERALASGRIVGMRYQIRALIGRGGMGSVYRARHLALRCDVALKVLAGEPARSSLATRFEREARAAATLHHPGCVRVLDYGRTVEGDAYLAMELLEGPTLAAALAEGPLSEAHATRVATQLLKALAHAHAAGVLHRDLKPENVILARRDGSERAVLIDFGLARLRNDAPLTAGGMCVGTPSYLSPERLLGRPCDGRADLYSLGVMLYEMLAGQRPFEAASPLEIARRHVETVPRPLRALCPELSPYLDAAVARALAKDPARRFPDAEAMLSALEEMPAAEAQRAAATRAREADEEPTDVVAEIAPPARSLPRRLWAWLRFGSWRWRGAERAAG